MTKPRVLLVASNDTHVRMFAPVMAEIERRGVGTLLVSLDGYYRQNAAAAAERAGLEVVDLPRRGRAQSAATFYARPVPVIWADTLAARRPVRLLLARHAPTTVVVGNDHGLLEKLVIAEAGARECRTVLIQDGRLAPRPSVSTVKARIVRALKAGMSPALRAIGMGYLASSDYGSGATDVICATGDASAELLRGRADPRSTIVVTGQPRYDRLAALEGTEPAAWDAVMFTTPFEASGLGRSMQRAQLALAGDLHAWAVRSQHTFAVKPHPRENAPAYRALVGNDAVIEGDADVALADSAVALIGMSTLIEEAALLGRPVVVPGSLVHGPELSRLLPPGDVYPRADTLADLIGWLERLASPAISGEILARQQAFTARQVRREAGVTASSLVADAILGS